MPAPGHIHCRGPVTVADPDLQMGGGGGSHPDPDISRGDSLKKIYFQPLRHQFFLKIIGGPGPPGPSPGH